MGEDEARPPSLLSALLPVEAGAPGAEEVEARLEAAGVGLASFELAWEPGCLWKAGGRARLAELDRAGEAPAPDDAELAFEVALRPAARPELTRFFDLAMLHPGLNAADRGQAQAAALLLDVSLAFGARPLRDLHRQLRLVAAMCPETPVVVDRQAFTAHPGAWVLEAAASRAPPPPLALYTIHAVHEGDDDDAPVWLHTHGLRRCGTIELDMLDVPRDLAGLAGHLLNVAGTLFIERGAPEPDTPFLAGKGLELVWLPWERGLEKVRPGVPGQREDRDDEEHGGQRGLLFAPGRGGLLRRRRYRSVSAYREVLEGEPLFYLSRMETERAAVLASERLPRFHALQARFGQADPPWAFLVKLGYPVDDAEDPTDREHLWFEVHAVAGEVVDATLLNAPYQVAALRQGERGRHSLALLSDWTIICEHGRFDPATLGRLERTLEQLELEAMLGASPAADDPA